MTWRVGQVTAMARASAALLALTLAAVVLGPAPVAARDSVGAQDSVGAEDAAAIGISVSRIDAVVTANDPESTVTVVARIDNRTDSTLTGVVGELSVRRRVTSRLAYHRALDAPADETRLLGGVVGRIDRPMADIPPGATRFLPLQASAQELGLSTDPAAQAVHPVRVEVDTDQGPLGGLTSALVVLTAAGQPLTGAALVRLDADIAAASPAMLLGNAPGDNAGAPYDEPLPPGQSERLARVATALAEIDVPLSVSVDNAIALLGGADEAVATLLERPGVERVLMPYARADLVALRTGGLADMAVRELRLGAAAWPGTTARPGSDVVAPWIGLDAATVTDVVTPFGTEAVVLTEDMLTIDEARVLPSSPSPVRPLSIMGAAEGTPLTVLVPDPWLTPLLEDRPDLDPLTVQRILAETALVYLERPSAPEQRGLILSATADSSPEGLSALLAELDAAPWLELGTLADVRATVTPGDPVGVDSNAAFEQALSPRYLQQLQSAQETLVALSGLVTESAPALSLLRENLLLAASADFRGDLAAGRTLINSVGTVASDLLGAVAVVGQPTVTLTDSVGQLPVAIRNAASIPLRVTIRLQSRRLQFPRNGMEVDLEPETTTTILFDAEARTPGGTAPVNITVTDPTGTRELATGTLVVRIAAYPGIALLVVVVAVLILLLWGIRDLRRRRQPEADPA